MAGSLEGPLAKLARADRQLDALEQEIKAVWHPLKPWPVRTEVHRSELEYRFYLRELPEIEPEWALWVGEIIFDLRSALDHLAYQLHVRRFVGKSYARFERVSQFPICDHEVTFRGQGRKPKGYPSMIALLGKRDRRALAYLQPYKTRHDRWQYTRLALSELSTIHNIDKHRKLHVVTGSHGAAVVPGFQPYTGFQLQPIWGSVKSHAHVETWTFTKLPAEMQDHGGAYLQIVLEYGDRSSDLLPLLQSLTDAVRNVLRRFSDRFPPS
jgi:hypothetical protein